MTSRTPSLRTPLLWALRGYTHTPLRGRTRVTDFLHPRLCPSGSPFEVTIDIGGLPFQLDLGERMQTRMFYGFYEPNEVAFVRRTLRSGQVFIDAGANIGYYTAVAAAAVGATGEVHAFEPVPWLHDRLRGFEQRANSAGFHVCANRQALGDEESQKTLWTSNGGNIGWSTIVPGLMDAAEVRETVTVQCVRMDDYFAGQEMRPADMVKIDVEGAELSVLEGMTGLFEAGVRPILLCEVTSRTLPEVSTMLSRFGYERFRCAPGGKLKPLPEPMAFPLATLAFIPSARSHE